MDLPLVKNDITRFIFWHDTCVSLQLSVMHCSSEKAAFWPESFKAKCYASFREAVEGTLGSVAIFKCLYLISPISISLGKVI